MHGVGRNRDSDPISGFIACCDGQLLSTRLLADTRLSIDACCLLKLVLSTDGGPSRCKSVYGTESHAPVNTHYMPNIRKENIM